MKPESAPSKVAVFTHFYGSPCRLIPRLSFHREDGFCLTWLGGQFMVLWGFAAEFMARRVDGKAQ